MTNLYSALSRGFPADRTQTFAALDDGKIVTYADLEARSGAFANVLVEMGVKPGDRVAVQADKSIEMLMLYLGCLRAGAALLPLNTSYMADELDYFIRDAEPALFVASSAKRAAIEPLALAAGAPRIEDLDETGTGSLSRAADKADTDFDTLPREGGDLAAILYTSGTTGRSKGAMLSHDNLLSNAMTLREYWRFGAEDVLLHALPIFHTHGLFVATNVVLAAGASMIFLPRFDVDAVISALPRATVMMGVPTFYIRLLDDDRFDADLVKGMRLFISGSAPLSAEIHREFSARTGHAILERYGMTETNMNTSNPYDGERRPGTVGFPLPGVDLRIVDADADNWRALPQGEVGVIQVKGPNVFSGYWRMPEKTEEELRGGWFMTGDLGLVDERGYVSIVGRAKDLIIAGGYNIYPAEVENVLDELPQVAESAVIGVPHRDMGEGVVGVVVARGDKNRDEGAILAALEGRIARFKQPRRIVFVDSLPKNAMGKVQKAALREEYGTLFSG